MKHARQHRHPDQDPLTAELRRLRRLREPEVTFERACAEIHANWFYGRAADSTVEALMLSLRAGAGALGRADTLLRLSELSKAQLREVAVRLQKLRPHIAPAWTPGDIAVLFAVRGKIHGRKNP